MIKIINAKHVGNYLIHLTFSDGAQGDFDMATLLNNETVLTRAIKTPEQFKAFFLELGALCWKNGLELSPSAIYHEMKLAGSLKFEQQAA
jgi:Protein of unknown function (DUF2442)